MKKRPSGVWLVFILSILVVGIGLLTSFLVLVGALPASLTQQPDFAPLGAFDWFEAIVVSVVLLAAAIFFFKLRKISILLFVTALLIDIVFSIAEALITHSMTISTLTSNIFGWSMHIAVIFYAIHLLLCAPTFSECLY